MRAYFTVNNRTGRGTATVLDDNDNPVVANVPPAKKKAAPPAQSNAQGCTCGKCGKPPVVQRQYTPPSLAQLEQRRQRAAKNAETAFNAGNSEQWRFWQTEERELHRDIEQRERMDRRIDVAGSAWLHNLDK